MYIFIKPIYVYDVELENAWGCHGKYMFRRSLAINLYRHKISLLMKLHVAQSFVNLLVYIDIVQDVIKYAGHTCLPLMQTLFHSRDVPCLTCTSYTQDPKFTKD